MLAQEVVIRKGKTLRFNLAIAKSFNADFDGKFTLPLKDEL
jgi:DNA-directed RNA polymerase beta' subunit